MWFTYNMTACVWTSTKITCVNDSLQNIRRTENHWQVTEVNQFLTSLERYEGYVVCTNQSDQGTRSSRSQTFRFQSGIWSHERKASTKNDHYGIAETGTDQSKGTGKRASALAPSGVGTRWFRHRSSTMRDEPTEHLCTNGGGCGVGETRLSKRCYSKSHEVPLRNLTRSKRQVEP